MRISGKRRGALLAALVAMGGCAVTQSESLHEPETLRAVGNEPGWRVDMDVEALELSADYGATRLRMHRPAPELRNGELRYTGQADGRRVLFTIRDHLCRDSMTGMPYPLTAELVLNDQRLSGCAGDPLDLLTGESWVVEELDGRKVATGSRVTVAFFDEGRVNGRGSCNQYGGNFSLSGEALAVSELVSTKMACSPALMEQERRFFDLLRATRRFDIDDDGALLLHTDDQRTMIARRD